MSCLTRLLNTGVWITKLVSVLIASYTHLTEDDSHAYSTLLDGHCVFLAATLLTAILWPFRPQLSARSHRTQKRIVHHAVALLLSSSVVRWPATGGALRITSTMVELLAHLVSARHSLPTGLSILYMLCFVTSRCFYISHLRSVFGEQAFVLALCASSVLLVCEQVLRRFGDDQQ